MSAPWAAAAASFSAAGLPRRPNYAGAAAFVFGPWYDANALTGADSAIPTAWGTAVRDNLF